MPTKKRVLADAEAGGSLAERHKRFADQLELPDIDAASWLIDEFCDDESRRIEVRSRSLDAAMHAFIIADAEHHLVSQAARDRERAKQADALASHIRQFVRGEYDDDGAGNLSAVRIARGSDRPDMKNWDGVLQASTILLGQLATYSAARPADARGTAQNHLHRQFALQLEQLWPSLWRRPRANKELHAFALALWRDMKFPLPEETLREGRGEEWMRSVFRVARSAR